MVHATKTCQCCGKTGADFKGWRFQCTQCDVDIVRRSACGRPLARLAEAASSTAEQCKGAVAVPTQMPGDRSTFVLG